MKFNITLKIIKHCPITTILTIFTCIGQNSNKEGSNLLHEVPVDHGLCNPLQPLLSLADPQVAVS